MAANSGSDCGPIPDTEPPKPSTLEKDMRALGRWERGIYSAVSGDAQSLHTNQSARQSSCVVLGRSPVPSAAVIRMF